MSIKNKKAYSIYNYILNTHFIVIFFFLHFWLYPFNCLFMRQQPCDIIFYKKNRKIIQPVL